MTPDLPTLYRDLRHAPSAAGLRAFLLAARTAYSLNWTTLAAALGVTPATMRSWRDRGVWPQSWTALQRLAHPRQVDRRRLALLAECSHGRGRPTGPASACRGWVARAAQRLLRRLGATRGRLDEVAETLKLHPRTVRRWLLGTTVPSLAMLERLRALVAEEQKR